MALNLISIGGMHTKFYTFKVAIVLTLGIFELLGQNATWMLIPLPVTNYTIKGKVVASCKFGPW